MPRIFKGSESTLRLLISKTGDYQALTGIKIKLYTTDIENAIEIIDGIQVCKNIAIITLAPRAFMGMEDGLINYIIDGATEDDVFHTERQSNYMLKSLSYINEDGVATQTMTIESNGEYRVTPNDGLYVDINVNVPDLNGSYDDGFNVGYGQGKTDGANEQKGKLESINITENGTYSKEDGYNHIEVNVPDLNGSYDEGYADAAAKARVLNVTKNGTYLSKFSDPIPIGTITGVYNDGTEFNNYAELNGKVFNTKIASSVNSRLEFWYKGNNTINGDGWNLIIGAGNYDDTRSFQVKYLAFDNNSLCMDGASRVIIDGWDDTIWHHLIVSETEGIWIDGEKKGDFPISTYIKGEFFINGIGYDTNGTNTANGTFGMIKIDDVVIIPTADGFLNTNTGELLEVVKDGGYTYTEGQVKYGEGELYKTINVNVSDLNGSYDEGYAAGEQAGYNSGYSQGQAYVAANARVLEVTENGNYLSKFSDPIIPANVTGRYADGTDFYNYALISNIIYSTGIIPNQNTRLEFWFKPYGTEYEDWEIIIGSQIADDSSDSFQIRRYSTYENNFVAEIGTSEVSFTMSENEWHHIIMSVADGFVLDGTKIGDFSENMTESNTPLQIGGSINFNDQRTEEGYYGMIKIDDTIIIPTENGFKNVTTDQILQILKDGSYTFTENPPKYGEGELYKTINVNVLPKINIQEAGINFAYSTFTEIPEWADFKGITNLPNMFKECGNLQTIPLLDTSNVTNMDSMFDGCKKLTSIPQLDTSNVTDMDYMFNYCQNLQTIPLFNTSNVTNMNYIFSECSTLQTIPPLNTSKVKKAANMFNRCFGLISIPALDFRGLKMDSFDGFFGWYELSNLTDFGGFLNLKYSLTNDKNLKQLPNLTYESCINVLNGLYDFTGNGETPNSNQGQLKVHQNFLDKVGDEISIGINKGWQITV